MASVAQLAQYLLHRNPDKNLGRLTLYNYLRFTRQGAEAVTEDLAFAFFASCMNFEHWREREEELKSQIVTELTAFFHQFSHVRWPVERVESWQAVVIKDALNAREIVGQIARATLPSDAKVQGLALDEQRHLQLALMTGGHLRVRQYGKVLLVRDGRLVPAPARSDLRYDPRMQLSALDAQLLEIAPHTQCLFRHLEGAWRSVILRGYSFQRVKARSDQDLAAHADVFFALKQLEGHYVRLDTDPFYRETVALLEKALGFLRESPDDALVFARNALERGRLAVQKVFPDDKMLTLLVNNLEFDVYKLVKSADPRRSEVVWPEKNSPKDSFV
jgi:hypothetical protein